MPVKKYIVLIILFFQCLQLAAKDYPASLFNIYGDGITINTRSIQFAIDYVHKAGGGRLVFEVGRYLTGSVYIQSGVTLQLQEGAVLLGSLNPLDYDRKIFTALIFAYEQHDIAITGKGIIDGQGRMVARNVTDLVHKDIIKDLFRNDRPEAENRPMLINFRSCENVLVSGVTLRNSASWVQTYDQCKNLQLDKIQVDSRAFWNNDGIDIVDCDSASVTDSYIDSDDDGICLKSHDDKMVCRNILLRGNTIRSSANAIKFGTASRGGFSNIRILDNTVFDTYRSAIALEAVDGGFIENVTVTGLHVLHSGNAIFLRIGERVSGRKSRLENIQISNVIAEIAATKPDIGYEYEGPIEDMPRNISPAVIIAGLPGELISNIRINKMTIVFPGGGNPAFAKVGLDQLDSVPEKRAAYPDFSMFRELPAWGVYIRHAQGVEFTDVKLRCEKKDYRMAVVLDDVNQSTFIMLDIKESGNKKGIYLYRSTAIISK